MDMHALAESLAKKAKGTGKPPGHDEAAETTHRADPKTGAGRPAKLPSEQRAAVAKKATASRSSAPRRSGK
jgi:hypothetical protein